MAVAQIHFQRVCYNQASPRFYLTAMKKTLSDILVTGFGCLNSNQKVKSYVLFGHEQNYRYQIERLGSLYLFVSEFVKKVQVPCRLPLSMWCNQTLFVTQNTRPSFCSWESWRTRLQQKSEALLCGRFPL